MTFNIDDPEMKETRQGFADALVDEGKVNPDLVVLGGDVSGSVKTNLFRDAFPDRFISVGVAEQDMIGTAAGLALAGKIPIASTYGEFATGRPFDQIRQSLAYSDMNVKICASHCGITVGADGATHQSFEDVGIMRILPGMKVITPCDYNQTYIAVRKAINTYGPFYIRFYREKSPNFTDINAQFEFGKADTLVDGIDVTLIASGLMVWEAILASERLKKEGIGARVVNMHTIKPIDRDTIVRCAKDTGLVITCEDHQWTCGLFGAVAEVLALHHPTKMDFVAINDTFGESGIIASELMRKYEIDSEAIYRKVKKNLKK
jgi:transketolase